MMRHFRSILLGLMWCTWLATPTLAAFSPGVEIFTNYANTGTVTENAGTLNDANSGRGGVGWYDPSNGDHSTPYRLSSLGNLLYTEEWATPRSVGTLLISTSGSENRGSAGTIYGQTTFGGAFNPLTTFNYAASTVNFLDLNTSGLYGVRVEVSGGSPDAYRQIGSLGIYKERFSNVALGDARIYSAGSLRTGDVTNQEINGTSDASRWMSDPDNVNGPQEEFVGVNFGAPLTLAGLLVDTLPTYTAWAWTDFDVQVFRGGNWVTLGRANVTPVLNDMYWINFGQPELAEQVRLYGSTAGGNNPGLGGTAGQGRIISDIMAFEFIAVPEPSSAVLLWIAIAMLPRLRRVSSLR